MIKNIGKLKQWTGEKFGSAKITLQTEDFHRLEVETERKRVAFEKLHASITIVNTQLLKRKVSPEDNKSKRLPHDVFGVCLTNYGNEFTDESALGGTCVQFGLAQSKMAAYQEEFADMMKADYMDKMDQGLQHYKEYQALRKKLESRRLDYDAKLSRLQKSKKEKPELEQEMQAAKMKYEDSEYDVIQKIATLQEFEDEHCEALQQLLEIQIEYFTRSLDVLNEAKSNWSQAPPPSSNRAPRYNNLSRTSSNQSGDMPTRSLTRNGSTDTTNISTSSSTRRIPSRKNSTFADRDDLSRSTPPPPPPALPRRQSSPTNQRKAVFDFSGDNSDELSFKIGDTIQVVEEVDEGWWIGEIVESDGHTRRGIFPVNYTEAKSAGPPMPVRPNLSTTTSSTTQHQIIKEEEESPFGDVNRPISENKGFSYIRPTQPIRSLSSNTNQPPVLSPSQSPIPQTYKSKRAPPPPPPSSRTPPVMMNSRSNTTKGIRTAPTTPYQQQQQDSYFDTACPECSCNDFSANIFKKGHCNNCFHKHF